MAEHGIAPDRPAGGQSLPVRRHGRPARTAATRRRSRTSTSAARRCCARRPRTTKSVLVVVDPADYAAVLRGAGRARRRQPVRHARTPCRQGLRPHRRLRHHGGRLSGSAACHGRLPSLPADAAAGLREGAGPALRRESAPAGRLLPQPRRTRRRRRHARACCRARICRTTTSPTPTPPSSACEQFGEPACVIVKHANPCGVALGAGVLRGLRGGVPHRSDFRLRRHHRLQPRARCCQRPRRSSSGSSSRCWPRPAVTAEAARAARRQAERARAGARRAQRPRGRRARVPQRHRRPAGAVARSRAISIEADLQGRHPPPADARRSWPTCCSPGGCASS